MGTESDTADAAGPVEEKERPQNGDDEDLSAWEIARRSGLASAWVDSRMERDKTVVLLSVAAIGFLISMLSRENPPSGWPHGLYVSALVLFVLATVVAVLIFQRNAAHVQKILESETGDVPSDFWLTLFDVLLMVGFIGGLASATTAALL